jgi:hypothetical protein
MDEVKQFNDPHFQQKKELERDDPPAQEDSIPGMKELKEEEVSMPTTAVVDEPPDPEPERSKAELQMEEMQREIRALRGQVQNLQETGPGSNEEFLADQGASGYPWQYYRRPDGWIVCAPGGAGPSGKRNTGAYSRYVSSGWQPIDAYGPCPVPTSTSLAVTMAPLLRRGGEKEFPVDQILEYGWHINPPYVGLSFPQIDKIYESLKHFACEECDTELWANGEDEQDVVRLSRVAFSHLRGTHEYTRREANLMLEEQDLPPFGRFAREQARAARRPTAVVE